MVISFASVSEATYSTVTFSSTPLTSALPFLSKEKVVMPFAYRTAADK